MSGYYDECGFYGLVHGRYMLFSSESDYYDMGEPEYIERAEYEEPLDEYDNPEVMCCAFAGRMAA